MVLQAVYGSFPSADKATTVPLLLGGLAVGVLCATMAAKARGSGKKGIRDLPRPSGLPFVGNLLQVFGGKPFLTFTQWAQELGDVFSIQLGSQRALVLNSIEAAREALVTKGKQFAGRPDFYTMSILHKAERKFVFGVHCDEMLKLYRKTVLGDIRKRLPALETIVENEVDKMAAALFPGDTQEVVVDMRSMIHKMAANVAHAYAFGHSYEFDDPTLQTWIETLGQYREMLHWFRKENFLPQSHLFLRDFQKNAMKFRETSLGLYKSRIDLARKRRNQGDDTITGLVDALLEMYEDIKQGDQENDDDIISVLRDAMFGGSDGAFQPLTWVLLYVIKNPWLQEKIQAEIADVIGSERMPTLAHREHMPYTEAAIREILRHSEITSLGIPRRTTDDVIIRDHVIPRDTLVIVNVYAIHRDERHWDEPLTFNPDRFLDDEGKLRPTSELAYLPFSTGHRACPGQNLAKNFLFLLFTRFFQRFAVHGQEGALEDDMNSGGSFNPELKPFKVRIEQRL